MGKKNHGVFGPVALFLALVLGSLQPRPAEAQDTDFTELGFITTWLFLGPFENPGGCNGGGNIFKDFLTDEAEVFEANFFPRAGDVVVSSCTASGAAPCYTNPDPNLSDPTVEPVDVTTIHPVTNGNAITNEGGGSGETDSVNFNNYWGGANSDGCPGTNPIVDNSLGYAVTYLNNKTGQDVPVRGQLGTDDSIQIFIGTETVYFNSNSCHHYGNSGVVQYEFESVLKKGVNRVMVKLYEGCGHWAYRLRFLHADTCAIIKGSDDFSIEREPPSGIPNVIALRDLPDQVIANDLVDVLIDIQVLSGTPGAAVVKERLPLFYEYVEGSASNGGTFADGVITWNLAAPLASTTLSYQVQAPEIVASAVFSGNMVVDGFTISIGGESSVGGTDPGWIKDWLILDGIFQTPNGTGCCGGNNPGVNALLRDWITDGDLISEVTIVPSDGLTIAPDFGGAAAGEGFFNGKREGTWNAIQDNDGCIDLNVMFSPNDQIMSYGATYVTNPLNEELELYMGVGSDDAVKVLLNGQVVWVNSVARGFCGGVPGGPQDTFGPVTLKPGKNLLMVGAWEGGGGWNFAARFQDPNGGALILPTSVDPAGYAGGEIVIVRNIPDTLTNGGSGTVTIRVKPVGAGGVVVIKEVLPAFLVPSNPSHNGTLQGTTITWNLGNVAQELVLSYTMTVSADAFDAALSGSTATFNGEPVTIAGDVAYSNAPVNAAGYIKMWNHLGPLGGSACDPGVEIASDWIVNEGETVTEANIHPFPGRIVRPKYGGDGILPGGTGARATGLVIEPGATGAVVTDRFPIWKGTFNPSDTIDHASAFVNGFDAENHLTMSQVYVTNPGQTAIDTEIGIGSDDAMHVALNGVPVTEFHFCRGWGAGDQNSFGPVTLEPGENRLLIKVTDGCCPSGFRFRFRDLSDPGEPSCENTSGVRGLLPPKITLSLTSSQVPPPGTVRREIAQEDFGVGETIDVSLVASLSPAADVAITEALPAGATAQNISDGGAQVNDTIEWSLAAAGNKTVSYKLAPATCDGTLRFGQASFKVGDVEAVVTGEDSLKKRVRDDGLDPWVSQDIGATGGAVQRLGPHRVFARGTGDTIGQNADKFRFVSIPAQGDFEVSARIDCLSTSAGSGRAGLMVRDTFDVFSANAFFGLNTSVPAGGGVGTLVGSFRRQTKATQNSSLVNIPDNDVLQFPIYLKLKRAGTKISYLRSNDGAAYTEVAIRDIGTGTTQINLRNDTLIGLAITGGGGETLADLSQVSGPEFPASVTPPNPPNLTSATPGAGQVALAWTAPAAGPAPLSYTVHRATVKGGPYTQVAEVPAAPTAYTNTGLAAGTEYCYVVRSKRGASESGNSNELCARTPGGEKSFRRGDVNSDGKIDVTDPVKLLGFLFLGQGKPECLDAGDTDDNGQTDISDAVSNLGYQFLGAGPPANPGPQNCGPDPSPDVGQDLGCDVGC